MPMLSKVGRRSARTRWVTACVYGLLAAGAAAILYPLGLLAAGSTKSMADLKENRLVPGFLTSDEALWQKHLEALFNESVDAMDIAFDGDWTGFENVPLPPPTEGREAERVAEWRAFLESGRLPAEAVVPGYWWAPQAGAFPFRLREFRAWLKGRFGTVGALNAAMGTDFEAWYNVGIRPPAPLFPHGGGEGTPLAEAMAEFTAGAPRWTTVVASPRGYYHRLYLKPRYGKTPEEYNRARGTAFREWGEVPLPAEYDSAAADGLTRADLRDFATRALAARWRRDGEGGARLETPDLLWNAWLRERGALGEDEDDEPMPQLAYQAEEFRARTGFIRREFLARNFRTVLDYVWHHGRGIWNTAVYCTLAVLLALVVNPLAAYALSRGRLRCGTQVLFFLMLTMAFPHMVTQIPVFVLLREFGLLNTFAALLLPGMASGYSIFLLKGFFDSLPQELYESARIDGAGEWTLFWELTMRLSTPILSVIALQAFTVAYANFMYALLICQDPKMWTLMVWLYQLQQRSGAGVTQASLLLAAIPTLLVFLACQRVLLRGIVVPVEK